MPRAKDTYIVIAREDVNPDGSKGKYTLYTRQVFATEQEAKDYAAGVNESREPMVVSGDFVFLRLPQ